MDYQLTHLFSLMSLEEKKEIKRLGAHRQNDTRQNLSFCMSPDFNGMVINLFASQKGCRCVILFKLGRPKPIDLLKETPGPDSEFIRDMMLAS